jgi:hypothetical protein
MLNTQAGPLVAARGGADDVDLVVDVEVADGVDALGAALGAGGGQQKEWEAFELAADLAAVAAELLDVAFVEIALGGHVVVRHVPMVARQPRKRSHGRYRATSTTTSSLSVHNVGPHPHVCVQTEQVQMSSVTQHPRQSTQGGALR